MEGYEFPVYSTDSCPGNDKEWKERSTAINCTKNNGYMCFPNEDITGLLEFCYIYTQLLITKGNWKKKYPYLLKNIVYWCVIFFNDAKRAVWM